MNAIARKARKLHKGDKPYATWVDVRTGWTYRLLKSYQADNRKPYARWLVDVEGWGHDLGDSYVAELIEGIQLAYQAHKLSVDTDVWDNPISFVRWTEGA